jgi:hypothetical protein
VQTYLNDPNYSWDDDEETETTPAATEHGLSHLTRRDIKKMLQHGSCGSGGGGGGWESDDENGNQDSHPLSTLNTLLSPLTQTPNILEVAKILNNHLTVSRLSHSDLTPLCSLTWRCLPR